MITKKSKYALKALSELTRQYSKQNPILISDLAEKGRIPKKFLEGILLELKNNGILVSKKGKGGGYILAKNPNLISVGNIIRILEGTLSPLPCLSQRSYKRCEECVDETTCSIRSIMKEVREATVSILDGTTLQEMLERENPVIPISYAI